MERFGFITDMIAAGIASGCFPSAAAAVGQNGRTLFTHAAGKLSLLGGAPVNTDTRYDLASMTKVFAPTMLTLLAVERGLIALDDTLDRFYDVPADKKGIAIHHLMTHTSGMTPHFMLEQVCKSPAEAIPAILNYPLEGQPGEAPRYSCMGYITLGGILEKVYGKPLDVLARELVFEPLGMEHTSYRPTAGNIAATEIDAVTGKPWQGVVHDENARFLGGVSANAGLFSDIGDCMRLARMLAAEGSPLLSSCTLRLAMKDRTPEHDVHRGLGFHVSGGTGSYIGDLFPPTAFGHTGFTGTCMAVDPETGLYAVLLTNAVHPQRGNPALQRFRRLFHNRVYAAAMR